MSATKKSGIQNRKRKADVEKEAKKSRPDSSKEKIVEDYQIFLKQQSTAAESLIFISGSAAELPLYYTVQHVTDIDVMSFSRNCCAISTEAFIPEEFKGTIYFIESIPDCPGYVRLRTGFTYLKREDFFIEEFQTEGPSYQEEWTSRSSKKSENKTYMKTSVNQHKGFSVDLVPCIVSPQWPLKANEWANRKRTNDWPSKDIIARIVDDGCHLVRKSHPNYSDDNEMFRFSFSKAEIILIKTWSSTQIHIYHLIRQVKRQLERKWKKENHKSAICTYYFKTLMLWACEEKCTEFWNECNIESSLKELLFEMIEWLIEKRCPNYFIPEYNMLDHLRSPDFDFEKETRDILERSNDLGFLIMKTPNSLENIKFSQPLSNNQLVDNQMEFCHNISYLQTSNREWLRSSFTSDSYTYSPLVREEFRDLYLGISEHYRFVTKFNNGLYLSKASQYLNRAVMDDRRYSVIEMNFRDTFPVYLGGIHTVLYSNQQKDAAESCCKSETRNQWNFATNKGISEFMHLALKDPTIFFEAAVSVTDGVDYTPRSAPKLRFNLSWNTRFSFDLSASYLANFHYSTRRDYDLAIRICEEASTKLAKYSGENSDPISNQRIRLSLILNNKLVVLFDQQIQTVFGFVVLVKGLQLNGCGEMSREAPMSKFYENNVSLVESRIFCRLRPLEFLNYVHYRCELQKYVSDSEQIPEKKHEMPTRPDFSFDSSSVILSAAARISKQ